MSVHKMVNDSVRADKSSAGPDTDARQADILGRQPRILPLTGAQAAAAIVENTQRLRKDILGDDGPALELSEVPEIIPTLMRHPDLWNRVCDLSIQLQARGVLHPRDRQLAAARLAWLCQAPYAWAEQVKHGKNAGLTGEDSERITIGSHAQGWDEHERAILRAVEELHGQAMISDETWGVLSQRLDENQLLELTVLVGHFTTISYFQNALRLRLPAGSIGLRAR
jgi:4-carboxymuconolactone decarboxylase